jgi:decaprenylphospho-beta-D-ribofuranose 2-oxidase
MTQADATLLRTAAPALSTPLATASVSGWGGGTRALVRVARPRTLEELPAAIAYCRARGYAGRGAIARGMGRSYGDAAQLGDGLLLDTTALKRFELDAPGGAVTAEAGVTLAELLDALVPAGFIVPVLPGTQYVSVGGALASDIHGKSHGVDGTFGSHVEALGLLTSGGEVLELSPPDPLFAATVGGMGLTGVILWARIRLRAVSSPLLAVDTDRVETLDQALAALSEPGGPYRVAWLDLLSGSRVRGVVTRAEHLPAEHVPAPAERRNGQGGPTVPARATIPAGWPSGVLRPATVRAFNELRFRTAPRRQRGAVESIGGHMFPLDALGAWPRLYGPQGFVQYQLVVPYGAESVLEAAIEQLRRERVPCYLAVLKDFGAANDFPLSFPIEGWTLALDLPRAAPGLDAALDRVDQLVAQAGGRIYLTKDDRTRPETLAAMYPRLEEWRATRERADPDQLWRSDLAERTGLVDTERRTAPASGLPDREPAATLPNRVLLLGGTSEIGLAIVRRMAAEGRVQPYLIGRDRERLSAALAGLESAGAGGGELDVLDADDLASHEQVIARAFERSGGFDTVVLAVGVLGGQAGLDADRAEALEVMRTNFMGSGSLLLESLEHLRAQGSGTLIVLSTVATERPRATNAIYGAAKAGLDALAQGLADSVAGTGVRVLVVRPGFVTTKMTAGLEPTPMSTTPEAVADATVQALDGSAHTVWVPNRLRFVFAVLRHLPRPVFRRLPL